jgi:hypothetical protein
MLTHYRFPFIARIVQYYAVFQVQELGRQRLPDEGKQKFEDEEQEIHDLYSTGVSSGLAVGSVSHKELNDSTGSKSVINEMGGCDTAEQSTSSASTAANNIVHSLKLNISTKAAASKERDFSAITKQNMIASKETSCIVTTAPSTATVTASKESSIAIATTKHSDSIVTTTYTAVECFANESKITVTAASKTCMDSTEDTKISTNSLEPIIEVKTASLEDNSDAASETVNQTNKAHCDMENNTAVSESEHIVPLVEDYHHRCINFDKIHSQPCVSDTDREMLCGTELGFRVPVINTDVEYNLEQSLLSVLKKEVGESVSQNLVPCVIDFFKKELNCMIHELMMKALSSVVGNVTDQCNQVADLHCECATGVTKISNMVQEWKKEMMLIADKQKAEKEKEMTELLGRAQKYEGRMSVLYHNDIASSQNKWEESSGNSCNVNNGNKNESYSNDSINFVPDDYDGGTTEKSAVGGTVQDFMQLQSMTDCQMVGTQKCVSDEGTQTVSTGCVLYLKCLPDL